MESICGPAPPSPPPHIVHKQQYSFQNMYTADVITHITLLLQIHSLFNNNNNNNSSKTLVYFFSGGNFPASDERQEKTAAVLIKFLEKM